MQQSDVKKWLLFVILVFLAFRCAVFTFFLLSTVYFFVVKSILELSKNCSATGDRGGGGAEYKNINL